MSVMRTLLLTLLVLGVCLETVHSQLFQTWQRHRLNVCTFAEHSIILSDRMLNHITEAVNSTNHCRSLLKLEQDVDQIPSPSVITEDTSELVSPPGPMGTNATDQEVSTEETLLNTTGSVQTDVTQDGVPTSHSQNRSDDNNINCSAIHHNFTLVTALINLHRENWTHFKRSFEHYLYFSIHLLKMNAPLVIYVEPSAVQFVRFHRQGKEQQTKIIETSIEDLEYYTNIQEIREIMNSEDFKREHPFVQHPEGFSAEYNILMNSKFSMLYEAASLNVFNSSHFYWLDMAYGHGDSSVFPDNCDWQPANIMYNESLADKITYIAINNISLLTNIFQIYKKDIPPFISGGFFGGSTKAVIKYYHIHRNMFRLFLVHRMMDDDQTLAILSYFADTSLFHFVSGWWFDAFKLFH